jgi:hypothetical protein
MAQFFTDDINALLNGGYGDPQRLTRIKTDFETKKLVTLEDRRYVEGLISRYLKAETQETERIVKAPEKRIVPPPIPPRQSFEIKYQKSREEMQIPRIQSKKKLRNIVISICSVVFAVLVISFVAMNHENLGVINQPPASKTLELDQASYARGDVISISGKASAATTVRLVISNPNNQQVWSETVSTKQNGEFSTLTIAGGTGWEQSGRYTLSSTHDGTTEQVTFNFSPNE